MVLRRKTFRFPWIYEARPCWSWTSPPAWSFIRPGHYQGTLVHGMLFTAGTYRGSAGCCVRGSSTGLDKDTSGLHRRRRNRTAPPGADESIKRRQVKKPTWPWPMAI